MARGANIIVSSPARGLFMEGVIGAGLTPKPGTILEQDTSVDLVGGRFTYKLYGQTADGDHPAGPFYILLNNQYTGQLVGTAYAAGERAFLYAPVVGEEFNLLLKDVSGTGDDHTKGEKMIVDTGSGLLIATTGTPETEPFVLNETITDPTADQLVWVTYSGY